MAKELPYFKFEPQEWNSGMIQLCSLEAKGIFIEICCLYWSRTGNLPYAFALQKLCNGDTGLLHELETNGIITNNEGNIYIKFLDEQLDEFTETSQKRRDAANKRWNDAKAMQKHSKSNAIREEKKRVEKSRKEESRQDDIIYPFASKDFLNYWNIWKDYKKDHFNFKYKSATSEQAALKKLSSISSGESEAIAIIEQSIENGWKGFFPIKQSNGTTKENRFKFTEEADRIINGG